MVSKKDFANLQEQVKELSNIVKTQELDYLRQRNEKLIEIEDLLSKVKFKIKNVRDFENENGKISIRITYELPTVRLELDENGEPNKDSFFYSTNKLEMISIEDMIKVQSLLNKYKTN